MRLTNICTRTGDKGTTGLGDGTRIDKGAQRIEVIGSVDELNSSIGLVLATGVPARIQTCLQQIQHRLFELGGELSMPDRELLDDSAVEELEQQLSHLNADLPPLQDFVLPGGSPSAATCHLARTSCRRTERELVRLSSQNKINSRSLKFLNRLSDLLFVIARQLNRADRVPETIWQRRT